MTRWGKAKEKRGQKSQHGKKSQVLREKGGRGGKRNRKGKTVGKKTKETNKEKKAGGHCQERQGRGQKCGSKLDKKLNMEKRGQGGKVLNTKKTREGLKRYRITNARCN